MIIVIAMKTKSYIDLLHSELRFLLPLRVDLYEGVDIYLYVMNNISQNTVFRYFFSKVKQIIYRPILKY